MRTIQRSNHYLGLEYGPMNIKDSIYQSIITAYRAISMIKNRTPNIEEIEEWIFRGIMVDIRGHTREDHAGDTDFERDYFRRQMIEDEAIEIFIVDHGKQLKKDIMNCLTHADLCYVDSSFESEYGTVPVVRNSPQVQLLKLYDVHGKSKG